MTYTVVPTAGAVTIVAAQSVTGFFASGRITAASLGSAERGDAAVVSGSTSNDGTYIVLDRISAAEI